MRSPGSSGGEKTQSEPQMIDPPLPHLTGETPTSQKKGWQASITRIAQLVTGIVLSTYAVVMFYNILRNLSLVANGQGIGILLMSGIIGVVGVKTIFKSFKRKDNTR